MGKRKYDVDDHASSRASAAASGSVPFAYSSNVLHGDRSKGIHMANDPAYGGYRESHDLPDEPTDSITINLDVTGSNRENAEVVWGKLPQLMALLATQKWTKNHLNMQFAFTGDATCDYFPLQLTQFESEGPKLDQWLANAILEGGGGGQDTESYQLTWWALCHQNKLDCWARGGKGILVNIFDEAPYAWVKVDELRDVYGHMHASLRHRVTNSDDGADAVAGLSARQQQRTLDAGLTLPLSNVSTEEVVRDLTSKYEVYNIICGGSSYYSTESTLPIWRKLFGEQSVVKLPDPNDIVSMIAALIGAHNGVKYGKITSELATLGTSKDSLAAIQSSLRSGLSVAKSDKVTRL